MVMMLSNTMIPMACAWIAVTHRPISTFHSSRYNSHQRYHNDIINTKRGRVHSATTTTLYSDFTSLHHETQTDSELMELLRNQPTLARQVYVSPILWKSNEEWKSFMFSLRDDNGDDTTTSTTTTTTTKKDHLWEQIKLEAVESLKTQPEAGPQLYQGILSQGYLLEAVVTIVARAYECCFVSQKNEEWFHSYTCLCSLFLFPLFSSLVDEIETELIVATEIKKLFLELLTKEDEVSIHCDIIAAATRSPSVGYALLAVLFQTGLHALICYRVGHRLWQQGRTGLAYYLQSTVSRQYSADIHPACNMGQGIYLCTSSGVVIGETATVGNDVSILQGVTLGGTGKETGDRHPKVDGGVILEDSATVLGNIKVGGGAVVSAKVRQRMASRRVLQLFVGNPHFSNFFLLTR